MDIEETAPIARNKHAFDKKQRSYSKELDIAKIIQTDWTIRSPMKYRSELYIKNVSLKRKEIFDIDDLFEK